MLNRVLASELLAELGQRVRSGGPVRLTGLWGSSAPMLAAAIGVRLDAPVLLVVPHLDDSDAAADDIEVLAGLAAELFPAWEMGIPDRDTLRSGSPASADAPHLALPADHVSDEIVGERLRICSLLAQGSTGGTTGILPVGITAVPAVAKKAKPTGETPVIPTAGTAVIRGTPVLRGTAVIRETPVLPLSPQFLVASISALMQPVPSRQALEAAGLTLRPGLELDPEKLAGWLVEAGYESVEAVDQQGEFARRGGIVDVFAPGTNQPVRIEFFGDQVESVRFFDLDTQRSTGHVEAFSIVATSAGREIRPDRTTTLLDYLPPQAVVCVLDPVAVWSLAETLHRRLGPGSGLHAPEALAQALARRAVVEMSAFAPTRTEGDAEPLDAGMRSVARLEADPVEALAELEKLSADNEVRVYCENQAEADRFRELVSDSHPPLAKVARLAVGHVSHGFHWPGEKLVVVGHHEIYHRHARPRRLRRIRAGRPIDSFIDLQEGDYVVHVAHGIAKFEGLRTLEKGGVKEEYLTLRFAEGALLHVPVTQIHLVQKYIGAKRGHPTLSHLGSAGWAIRKKKVADAVEDLAAELLRVQALRADSPGVAFPGGTEWQRKFEGEFPYEETEDQLSAAKEIGADLAEPRPMDRLLCGDVGFGKTELAMRAAFRVVEAGKQAAVLVPTTVLAAQHYRTFRERFADYPFSIDVISRFRTKADQAAIVARAAGGQIDILIGTHRLLSADVRFADLGLVIIDEEQRFGVEHKERLKRMRATVEVLTLTATPIPRTLHMAMLGLRDISNLATPPLDRRAIYTELCQENDQRVRDAILRELERGGQIFFVHNRVFSIQSVADHVARLVPEARVAIGHGQMSERELEDTMYRFVQGQIDVLVCTTIIESGLDIPTANTMFVHEADRFGLAQLHQLRGRIGRYKNRAYCYLLLPKRRPVSREAAKRLKAVEEFSDLGAGFQIAMRDLEIRGAGNILGAEQSGHIAAVGYELYCQLLEQAVRRMRGQEVPKPIETHVELAVEALIPRSYIASGRQRMEVYRRLANATSPAELERLEADLADAYGPVPPVVRTLVGSAEVRVLAGLLGVRSIILMPPDVVFALRDSTRAAALRGLPGTVRLADPQTAHWRPPPPYLQQPTLLTVLRKHLRKAAGTVPPQRGGGVVAGGASPRNSPNTK